MVSCTRNCLQNSIRILNVGVHCFGVLMIIYSLWLLKRWREAVAELGPGAALPPPWFIYTCLGVGMTVCLSMFFGYMVANQINVTVLTIYILAICFILILQVGLIVVILFKMDYEFAISDGKYVSFKNFLGFHLTICRWTGITALLAQANILMLAIAIRSKGPEPESQCRLSSTPEFSYSFLEGPD